MTQEPIPLLYTYIHVCTLYLRYGRQSDTGAFVGIVHELVQVFHELKE